MTELEECSGTEDSDADLLKKAEIVESEKQLLWRESKSRYHFLLLDSDLSVLKFMLTYLSNSSKSYCCYYEMPVSILVSSIYIIVQPIVSKLSHIFHFSLKLEKPFVPHLFLVK